MLVGLACFGGFVGGLRYVKSKCVYMCRGCRDM